MGKLKGVVDTLYIPLTARINISKRFPDFFYDEKALELEKELPDDSIERNSGEYFYMASVCRYKVTDDMIRKFIKSHDRCNIINLGAGLETAYYRIKPAKALFYEMDLPEVINVEFVEALPFFTEARRKLGRKLKVFTRIAMKVVDEGGRKGFIIRFASQRSGDFFYCACYNKVRIIIIGIF